MEMPMFEEINPEVTVVCDRCGKTVDGLRLPGVATSGFYESSHSGGIWDKYMESQESILCDACMWADPRYQETYGRPDDPPSD